MDKPWSGVLEGNEVDRLPNADQWEVDFLSAPATFASDSDEEVMHL